MIQGYEFLAVCLLLFSALVVTCRSYQSVRPDLSGIISLPDDAESRLAMGAKIRYSSADMYDLLLIPGVGDDLAQRMLESRSAVLARARQLAEADRTQALLMVKGIGEKKAIVIAEHLSLD